MEAATVEIVKYNSSHQKAFETLNPEWIEKYFWMEPVDFEVLQNPDKNIISHGGEIFMAQLGEETVGTVALKFVSNGVYEFTKMAVNENHQGKQIGKKLALAAIEEAKARKADKIILYSNTKLDTAIQLYFKLGFVEVPVDGPYKRSNIKMEMSLQ